MSHTPDRLLRLEAGETRLLVDPTLGARVTSLETHGHELIVTEGFGPIRWGSYPMAPFAGRFRDGRFRFDGRDYQLPLNLPPHAIHGTVFERAWTVSAPDTLTIDLGPDWPFPGRVTQRFALAPDSLSVELILEADAPMPGAIGWHPWFRRVLRGTAEAPLTPSAPVELAFNPGTMYERGPDGLPTGRRVPPTPRPWDDCFTDVRSAPRLTWPDVLTLEIRSSVSHWVVYDEPEEGVCVEPQTAPPDFPAIAPVTVVPGAPLRAEMTWHWWAER